MQNSHDDGFDYTQLPKVNHDDYDIPDSRGGWHIKSFGGLTLLIYAISVLLCIVLWGNASAEESRFSGWLDDLAVLVGAIPLILGIIGLFIKVGRWHSLITLILSIVFNPVFAAVVFIQFSFIVAF